MICKYCGARYEGGKCTLCGKVQPLVKRSTELDILMSASSGTPGEDTKSAFDQGFKKGYQKGLMEGYANGKKDGSKEKAALGAEERGNEGEQHKTAVPIPRKRKLLKLAAVCAAILAAAGVSGLIGSRISYRNGFEKGTEQGIQTAASTYEPQIHDLREQHRTALEQAETEAHAAGYAEAVREMEARAEAEAAVSPSAPPDETAVRPEDTGLDFPYSKARNGGNTDPVVKAIQTRLRELGYKGVGGTDGIFGPNTERAVRKFQKEKGIKTENPGEVDEATYYALFPEKVQVQDAQGAEKETASDSGTAIDAENGGPAVPPTPTASPAPTVSPTPTASPTPTVSPAAAETAAPEGAAAVILPKLIPASSVQWHFVQFNLPGT